MAFTHAPQHAPQHAFQQAQLKTFKQVKLSSIGWNEILNILSERLRMIEQEETSNQLNNLDQRVNDKAARVVQVV